MTVRKTGWLLFYCFLIFAALSRPDTTHADVIQLADNLNEIPIGRHLEILEDKTNTLKISDIVRPEYADKFRKSTRDNPNFGFTESAYWLKFMIRNTSSGNKWLLEIAYPQLDLIDMYVPDDKGGYTHQASGDYYPFHTRAFPHRNFIFNFAPPKAELVTVYIRIKTQSSNIFPLTIWEREAFARKDHVEEFGLGIYYGIALVMLLYNLFIYLSLLDKSYLCYVVYIGVYTVFQLCINGIAFEYLWPDSPKWNDLCLPLSVALTIVTGVGFAGNFLAVRENIPKLSGVWRAMLVISVITVFLTLVLPYGVSIRLVTHLTVVGVVLIVTAGVAARLKKYIPARFFLVAWGIYLVGQAISAFHRAYGIIPANLFSLYGYQIGSAIEMILLSLALADRINIIRDEKNKAQEQVIQALRVTDELNEKLKEYNQTLERKVEERTSELTEAYSKLKQLDSIKSDFLANVSHELRTPLTSILGFATIIRKKLVQRIFPLLPADEKKTADAVMAIEHNLGIVISESERLRALINDVLDLAKLESGKTSWRIEALDPYELLDKVMSSIQSLYTQKNLRLLKNPDDGLPDIRGDMDKLIQVLINLLSNAQKFTDSGEVRCTMTRDGDFVVFGVVDTGCGIDPKEHAAVFDKFRQVGDTLTDKPRGTGLGLPIAREIVEYLGGRIWVESEQGKGSAFYFTVPVYREQESVNECSSG